MMNLSSLIDNMYEIVSDHILQTYYCYHKNRDVLFKRLTSLKETCFSGNLALSMHTVNTLTLKRFCVDFRSHGLG